VWNLTNDEKVNNFDLYLDLKKAVEHTDIRVSYDYSDSDNAFIHSGPRITELSQNVALTPGDTKPCAAGVTSCFLPLPNVTNSGSAAVDLTSSRRRSAGPRLPGTVARRHRLRDDRHSGTARHAADDYLGEINTGYGIAPAAGNTRFVAAVFVLRPDLPTPFFITGSPAAPAFMSCNQRKP
jgi:hypothetical protein